MESLFTIHAGEYLVGTHIEKRYKNITVWIPSKRNNKDIDLLVSNADNTETISIQVKSSKDYTHEFDNPLYRKKLMGSSFFNIKSAKLSNLKADLMVFVIHSFKLKKYHYIILKPEELLNHLKNIHGDKKDFQFYFWITKDEKCWDARGLKKQQKEAILDNDTIKIDNKRDFSSFLNNWKPFESKLCL